MLNKKILSIVWMIGMMSGFALMITAKALNFWLTKSEINLTTIGVFALILIPYSINFLWSPIFDVKKLPILDRFLGSKVAWVVFIQCCLSVAVFIMSTIEPEEHIYLFAICGLCISFFASTQDVILGSIKTLIGKQRHQITISGIYVFGYRTGMFASGALAIYISQYISFNVIYKIFAIVILIFPILLISCDKLIMQCIRHTLSDNPDTPANDTDDKISILDKNLFTKAKKFTSELISSFGDRKYIIFSILFLILARLPEEFIMNMIHPFLWNIGYNASEIATFGTFVGSVGLVLGGLMASYFIKQKNLYNSFIIFGIVHSLGHLTFVLHMIYGKNIYILIATTCIDSITGGILMTIYYAFISSLCRGRFAITKYAFCSSVMGLSRAILPTLSGFIINFIGWEAFYIFPTIAAIPSLMLMLYLKKLDNSLTKESR